MKCNDVSLFFSFFLSFFFFFFFVADSAIALDSYVIGALVVKPVFWFIGCARQSLLQSPQYRMHRIQWLRRSESYYKRGKDIVHKGTFSWFKDHTHVCGTKQQAKSKQQPTKPHFHRFINSAEQIKTKQTNNSTHTHTHTNTTGTISKNGLDR